MVIENAGDGELRFRNPGSLLVVVLGFLFWGVGLLDLLGHTSRQAEVFGLYSLPFFVFILLYAGTIVIWLTLFISPSALQRVTATIRAVQSRTWLALLTLILLGVALWIVFEWDRWSRLPGLQFAAFALVLLATGVLIFSGWREHVRTQPWRRIVAYPLFALIAVEATVQGLAYFGLLPGTHSIGGHYVPYERIYYNEEGFRNGYANRYGWTFPDRALDDNRHRILIVGGSHVQALGVEPAQQMSVALAEQINQAGDVSTEVISIGLPGFGPSPYLYEGFLDELMLEPGALYVDEMIVMFHLGDDFQSAEPSSDPVAYELDEGGIAQVKPEDAKLRHDLTHYFMRGYLSFQIVETIRSNILTPRVLIGLVDDSAGQVQASAMTDDFDRSLALDRRRGVVSSTFALTEPDHAGIRSTDLVRIPHGNDFLFESNGSDVADDSMVIASSILRTAYEAAAANDITLRVVTLPAFPAAFFTHFQGDEWKPEIGDYDLLRPERALVEASRAHGIPLLAMGHYMDQERLPVESIEQLYYSSGQGGLTPFGHRYFADAIYACFYSDSANIPCYE